MTRVAAVVGAVFALALLAAELSHRRVEEDDAAVRASVVALRVRSSHVDVVALQTLLQRSNNFDALTRAVDALDAYNDEVDVGADATVKKDFDEYRRLFDSRMKTVEKLKGARGRLINIEHYLPVHLDELRAAHPDDDSVVAVRSTLLAYLLDPSPSRLDELGAWKNKIDPSDARHQHLIKTRQYLIAFSQARDDLARVTVDLGAADLAGAADAVVAAEDVVVAAHRADAERRRLGLIGLGLVGALVGLWWPARPPRWLARLRAR